MTKTLMLQSRIEALLFVVGDDGLTIKQLSQLLGEQEELILQTMNTLRETYEEDLARGITVKKLQASISSLQNLSLPIQFKD